MIAIYLCDDNPAVRCQVQTFLERKILIEDYDMHIVCSTDDPEALLDILKQKDTRQGVYFLDIDLKNDTWDGFLLGQAIRRLDPRAILVYITSYADLAFRTFQYHLEVFDYIVKEPDRLEASVLRCLEDIYSRLVDRRREPEEVFTLRTGDMLRHIPVRDILYFETAPTPHHVLLHTANSRLDFVGSLNDLAHQLGSHFVRTHRAYLVAEDKIEAIDLKRNRLFAGGRECLISRAGKAELRRRMENREQTVRDS